MKTVLLLFFLIFFVSASVSGSLLLIRRRFGQRLKDPFSGFITVQPDVFHVIYHKMLSLP